MKTMNGVVSWYILLFALYHLFHFIACASFLFIFSFFLVFCVSSFTREGIEVSLAILKIKHWSCFWVPRKSFKGVSCYTFIQQLMLLVWLNQLSQVQFGKKFSFILHLTSQNCLLHSISVKLRYQFLYLTYCFLFFRCFEKGFEKERNKKKDGNSGVATTSQLPQKKIGMMKFLAYLCMTLMSSFTITSCFQKVIFKGFNLLIYSNRAILPNINMTFGNG